MLFSQQTVIVSLIIINHLVLLP